VAAGAARRTFPDRGLAGLGEKALQLSKATGVTAQKSLVFPKATRGVVASR